MTIPAQQIGQLGRLEGDPQLRGHFGRIPFSLLATVGKTVLFEGGATASLIEGGSSATLIEGGATATLTEDEC